MDAESGMVVRLGDGVVRRADDELVVIGAEGGAFFISGIQVNLQRGVLVIVTRGIRVKRCVVGGDRDRQVQVGVVPPCLIGGGFTRDEGTENAFGERNPAGGAPCGFVGLAVDDDGGTGRASDGRIVAGPGSGRGGRGRVGT